jgi:hypothetical protein
MKLNRPLMAPDGSIIPVKASSVIPAKAGIHRSGALSFSGIAGPTVGALDPGFRRDDEGPREANRQTNLNHPEGISCARH